MRTPFKLNTVWGAKRRSINACASIEAEEALVDWAAIAGSVTKTSPINGAKRARITSSPPSTQNFARFFEAGNAIAPLRRPETVSSRTCHAVSQRQTKLRNQTVISTNQLHIATMGSGNGAAHRKAQASAMLVRRSRLRSTIERLKNTL